jgi:hypothetical protein
VHELAFVDNHVSVALCDSEMIDGLMDIVTVGTGGGGGGDLLLLPNPLQPTRKRTVIRTLIDRKGSALLVRTASS